MSLIRLLSVLLCFATAICAQAETVHGTQGTEPSQAETQHEGDHGHGSWTDTMKTENARFFIDQYKHLEPHKSTWFAGADDHAEGLFTFYNINEWQLYAVLLSFLIFSLVKRSFGKSSTGWFTRVFRGWVHWIRDEMVYSIMGKEAGRKFAPYFISLFFFIAFINVLGLIPGSATSTATAFVTIALALLTFGMMLVGGMMEQGVVSFWKNLLPHGLPMALVPLLAVLEIIGLLVKPFALTIRLFANMLAGHLVIYSFIGMIFVFAKMFELGALSWVTMVPAVGMGIFISIIEAFVGLLQAYIFTFLSIVFVQQALHPEH